MVQRQSVALIVAAAVAAGACRREAPKAVEREETVIPVGAIPAQRAAIRAVIHASGVVVPAEGGEFLVFAPEPTRLIDVAKMPGDAVKSGDVLARFDLPSAALAVSRLAADLAGAQAQLENARINQERTRGFVERGLVPRRDLEAADRDFATAQDAAERARTAHAAAQAGATGATARVAATGTDMVRLTVAGPVTNLSAGLPTGASAQVGASAKAAGVAR